MTVAEVPAVVAPGPRLDALVRLAEAVDVLLQLSWTELRQVREEPVRIYDDAAMYQKPNTENESQE